MINFGWESLLGVAVVWMLLSALYLVIFSQKLDGRYGVFIVGSIVSTILFGIWQLDGLLLSEDVIEDTQPVYTHGSAEIIIDEEKIPKNEAVPVETIGMDISMIKSAPAEKEGITLCSKTARITLKSLTSETYSLNHDGGIPQGDAITLIKNGLLTGSLTEIGFSDKGVNPSQELFEMLAHNGFEIADVYLYRSDPEYGDISLETVRNNPLLYKHYLEQAHRFVVILGNDGILYVLDPYRGKTGEKPQRFHDYVSMIEGWTMYVGGLYEVNIDTAVLTIYENSMNTYSVEQSTEPLPEIEEVKTSVAGYLQVKNPKTSVDTMLKEQLKQKEGQKTMDELEILLDI